MNAQTQSLQRYRELQVTTSSPVQRLLMVYDAAFMGCARRDLKKTTDALNLLRNSLDFHYEPVATGLFRLYQYCADAARAGDYEITETVLRGLVQAWVEVLMREKDSARPRTAALAEMGLLVAC